VAKSGHFDLILLDYQLGYGIGTELSKQNREFNPNIPILFVTSTYTMTMTEVLKAGAQRYSHSVTIRTGSLTVSLVEHTCAHVVWPTTRVVSCSFWRLAVAHLDRLPIEALCSSTYAFSVTIGENFMDGSLKRSATLFFRTTPRARRADSDYGQFHGSQFANVPWITSQLFKDTEPS
jgi:hypothetical protein